MGALKDQERNDAKTMRIVDACLRSMTDPRFALAPMLSAEGVHPDNIARLSRAPVTLDSVARLLNYHFAFQTFAILRKNNRTQLVRLADGTWYTPGNILKEFPE
jgi:hypothetical protein